MHDQRANIAVPTLGQAAFDQTVAAALALALDYFQTAVLVVDGTGSVRAQNQAARRLFCRSAADTPLVGDRLALASSAATERLRTAVACACMATDCDQITRWPTVTVVQKAAFPFSVMIVPLTPDPAAPAAERLAVVFASNPQDTTFFDAGQLVAQFGLSRAEADIAARVAAGEDLDSISVARKVSRETIRTQLKSVLAKTGVASQTRLVALVARSLGCLRQPGI